MIVHKDEIYSRPKRTWFVTEKEKRMVVNADKVISLCTILFYVDMHLFQSLTIQVIYLVHGSWMPQICLDYFNTVKPLYSHSFGTKPILLPEGGYYLMEV